MTVSTTVSCPHCGAANPSTAAFCESCGKALPSAVATGPRVVTAATMPQTALGQQVLEEELRKQTKKASIALGVVAGLTTAGAILFAVLIFAIDPPDGQPLPITGVDVVINLFVAGIFWALFVWARKNPLPPAIVGLVLYITMTVLQIILLAMFVRDARAEREAMGIVEPAGSGASSSGMPGIGGLWLKIFIIVMFVQAIQAGVKHRKLKQQIAASNAAGAHAVPTTAV